MSQELVMIEDRKNSLLSRREVKALFKGAAGKLKKTEASEQVASQLGVDKKNVIPVNLICETGMTDVHAIFYVYESEEVAKKQLPRFRMLRTMPKAERKKLLDDEKAERLKAKQAAAADAKGGAKK
ncbi:30S ribosomal protein S24e [Candidatus Nitrososphaera sp. FF02]|uniref:30S ribosomal protein S24e n=1 Tax=Candidatus Nitrososphaera sp. FF02 TaxID=3398226 RepID=UPI0039E7C3EC